MEVYISDKDKKWDISYSLADSNNSLECKDHKPIIVKSLEQHDKEIRKPLEEEIEMLKKENKQLIKDNRLLDKTKYTAQQDDIIFFVEQERQKVIAELEKELEKTKCLYNDSIDREIFLTDEERRTYYKNVELKKENAELKQKLADLKGETK